VTPDPNGPAVPGLEPPEARTPPPDLPQDPTTPSGRFRPEEHPRVVEPAPRTRGLDMSKDPDRFDPDAVPELPRGLDPAYDPDRFRPPGQGQTLTDLLGKEGTQEGDRDGYQWVMGLVGVFVFLGLVAFLFNSVLTP
jgi:hypothetical protein